MAHICIYRDGQIVVSKRCPDHAASIMKGPAKMLKRLVVANARHSRTDRRLFVPGVPEAEGEDQAVLAVLAFQARLNKQALAGRAA